MSSDFPPQLQLRLPPASTSFKRSFEEYGFDLASPSGSETIGSANGNERNKRPRSASSHSDTASSPGSSQSSSTPSSSSSYTQNSSSARSALSATRPSLGATHEVHTTSSSARPFHDITVLPPTIQDVEMLSYLPTDATNTQSSSSSPAASPSRPQPNEQLRLSLERFNAFDAEISELRRSHSVSPLQPRTITPPPTLPPLMLSDDQPDLAAAALPFLHPEHRTDTTPASPHGTDTTLGSSSHTRRSSRDDVHPRISDARPFRIDLHIDPGLQPTQRSQNSLLLSAEDPPLHVSPENHAWAQTTHPNEPALSELEFTFIRDRLNSALEPLRSASPLVPGLVEPRSPLPIPSRQSRTTAPTLPPLRTQLQQSGAWDDRSYRMLLFGPSIAAAANNHDREGRTSDILSDTNNNSSRSQSSYWNETTYGISERLNSSSIASNRDREPTSQDLPPTESASAALGLQLDPFQPQTAPMYEDLDVDPIPVSEPQRNPTQQLPSSSSESLGYMSSEEWFPMLRRRSAWRLLDSDEEERLSIDARRLRLLAERRDASRTTRPGPTSTSLDAGDHTHPWVDLRRHLSNRSSAPRPILTTPDRHVPVSAPFDGVHVWEDTDSDPMSGHAESDAWTSAEHYPRSTRADISQRSDRLSDDISIGYNSGQPSLTRSNTNTSTLAAFSRLRNRLYHSSSTRFASSNSLVTENSSEFRRRIARQEWMERWTRLNDERAQSQSEVRPPPRSMPELSVSDEPRRPELRINTSTSLDRRLFGGLEGLEEARRASELDAFNFHGDNIFETSFPASRRAAALARPARNDHPVRRPSSPPQPSLSRQAPGLPPPPGLGTDRFSRFFEYLHNYPDSSPVYPPPAFNFGPVDAPHRASDEPVAHRDTRDPQNDWFSRRRHSTRPSQSQINPWGEIDSPDFGIANAGRGPGPGLRTDPAAGLGERDAAGAGLRSSFDRHTRTDEPPRISPIRAISPYFIDVPPLPSPDLSEFFENVPHFQPHPPQHEERLAASRPLPELSSRVPSRRRSPSPAVRGPPQTRPRLDRPVMRSATGFENIDPELFAPGPYRNTFQSLRGRRDPSPQISQPPTIPPFPFEAPGDREMPSSRRHHSLYAEPFDGRSPSRQTRTDSETEPRSAFWRSRPAFYVRNEWESSSPSPVLPSDEHRHLPPASDLHNFLSRHVSARMERAEAAAAANVSRFNHAIEVLRGEGLSRRPSFDRPPGGGRASGDAPRERSSLDWLAAHHHHHQHVRPRRARARRIRPLGDYMRDEDFDESYESLLSLAAAIGDVKPRCTPEEVISKLETAMYKDWATQECDKRCPICLDDYGPNDTVMKVGDCAHWLHKDCLHQWLKGANTCPVCRMVVHSPRLRHARQHSRGETSTNHSANDGNGPAVTQNSAASNLSTSTETPNSFSARPRPFGGGWPSWRYYHP